MIDIDASRPAHRAAADLHALVRAVESGLEPDEWTWIEAKSTLDLNGKAGWFALARAIIGLANRTPAIAERWCAGWGYVIVGAEPGDLAGIAFIDPQRLAPGVSTYLGPTGDAPVWEPCWVDVDGRHVLVAAVAPPRPGDHIWTVRKEYTDAKDRAVLEGTILVRDGGQTKPATTAQVRALVARARDPDVQLRLEHRPVAPLAWLDEAASQLLVDQWVAARRQAVLQRHPDLRPPPPANDPRFPMLAALETLARASDLASKSMGMMQPKQVAAYQDEVDKWARALRATAWSRMEAAFDRRFGGFELRLVNGSNAHLEGLQVVVELPLGVTGRDKRRIGYHLPLQPKVDEPLVTFAGNGTASFQAPSLDLHALEPRSSSAAIEQVEDGRQRLVYDVDEVRRGRPEHTAPVWLDLDQAIAGNTLVLSWTATVHRPQAWDLAGTVEVPVAAMPVSFVDLRDAVEGDA